MEFREPQRAGIGQFGVDDADDNVTHAREALILSGALSTALAQASSLTDLLRPRGRSRLPTQHVAPASPATAKSGYQSGYRNWVAQPAPNGINRIERKCC